MEAICESLAGRLGEDAELWATMALLSQLDREFTEANPIRRGQVAAEQAALEGLPRSLCQVLEHWRRFDDTAITDKEQLRIADALLLGEQLTEWLGGAVADGALGDSGDLASRLDALCSGPTERSERFASALSRLGLSVAQVAACTGLPKQHQDGSA